MESAIALISRGETSPDNELTAIDEYNELMNLAENAVTLLKSRLNNEDFMLVMGLQDYMGRLLYLCQEHYYVSGYKLAARTMAEVFAEKAQES